MFFYRTARALAHAQIQWIGLAYRESNTLLALRVQSHLRTHQSFSTDGNILLTKLGFSAIAIHADYACVFQDTLVVPGVDHQGRRGFLVLNGQDAPFYSLAASAGEAFAEANPSMTGPLYRLSHA